MLAAPAPHSPKGTLVIGNVTIAGRVLLAPMTGVSDLPFRQTAQTLGAPYVATEMVACELFAKGRPDAIRRAAMGSGTGLMVVQLVGREAAWLAAGAKLAAEAGADLIDINMGCPAKDVTGGASGAALMRDLDHAERLIAATVAAVKVPVTVKMRLGWDAMNRNAPELAQRAERAGAKAVTVHARTRQQFYTGQADWRQVRPVREATRLPVIVNGDITDGASAREALDQSGADGVMVGRGAYGRPWVGQQINAVLTGQTPPPDPSAAERLALALTHFRRALAFYGDEHGVRIFRKHLGWYVERAPFPETADARREAKAQLCRLTDPNAVEAGLTGLWGCQAA